VIAEAEEGSEEGVEACFAFRTGVVGTGWVMKELQVVECWLWVVEPVLCVLPVVVAA